jgi:hypothetical protein
MSKAFGVNGLGPQVSSPHLHLAVLVIFAHPRQDTARSSKEVLFERTARDVFLIRGFEGSANKNYKEMIYENNFQDGNGHEEPRGARRGQSHRGAERPRRRSSGLWGMLSSVAADADRTDSWSPTQSKRGGSTGERWW